MSVSETKELLQQFGLTPNRALGQNFLCDDEALHSIAAACDLSLGVLEIGPGLGALTARLLPAPKVLAVELDAAMIKVLLHRFDNVSNLKLMNCDFLKTDMDEVAALLGAPFCVAANLPYYVTTPICLKLLGDGRISRMTLMLQKEAAQRFFAVPGDRVYGPLAVQARCFYNVERLLEVEPTAYYPQPEISSTVICLSRNALPFQRGLAQLAAQAFSMRRKTLQNNLKPLGMGADFIRSRGIDPSLRAEALPPEAFLQLL